MMNARHSHDPCARRIVVVIAAVCVLLLSFYGFLAFQAWSWSPGVYIQHTASPRSRTLLDQSLPAWDITAAKADAVVRGRRLYYRVGCAVCHGIEGKGGVTSPNYQRGSFPRLDNISERLFLEDIESHEELLAALRAGVEIHADSDLDIERLPLVAAQISSVASVIVNGNPAQKADEAGPVPIPMPRWGDRLTSAQIQDLIAYFVSLQDLRFFEDEEDEGAEE